MAIGLAGLVGVERLLQRLDLPLTPVWPAYFMLIAVLPGDDDLSGGGASMPDTSQDGGQPTGVASEPARIVFLHHSTGHAVWVGDTSKVSAKILGKSDVKSWIASYNKRHNASHQIEEMNFPTTSEGYPWANYPYDYYNIWVKHAGDSPYRGEPTLEVLTKEYDVIIWKHCFPVASILPDTGMPEVDSDLKRLENYKLQYAALKEKMRSFPDTKFIVWTGAAPTLGQLRTAGPTKALRARQFFDWVKSDWDEPGDNIFLWDFYQLETEGGIYLKTSYASGLRDPHPRADFAGRVAPLFAQRIIDVVNGRGDTTPLTGQQD
ncbi:MAG: hypothetical protein ACXW39_10765 [Nitrospira sp.]